MKKGDYRQIIYNSYNTSFRAHSIRIDEKAYIQRTKFYKKKFKDILPVDKKAKILDIGCGEGFFLYFAKMIGYNNITGVDISPEQVYIAKKYLRNVQILQTDFIDYLSNTEDSFDFIVLDNVIEHFSKEEIVNILKLIFTKLNKDGRLVISVPNAGSPWGMPFTFFDFTHETVFTPQSMVQLLSTIGYQVIKIKGDGRPYPLDLLSLIRSILYYPISLITIILLRIMTGGGGRTKIIHIPDPIFMVVGVKR